MATSTPAPRATSKPSASARTAKRAAAASSKSASTPKSPSKTASKASKSSKASKAAGEVSQSQLLSWYEEMLLIRRFEERAGQLYGMGMINGFCHLYIGQEAVVTGIQAALQQGDSVVTSYRDHGHMLASGMDPNGVMAELTGRKTGFSKGKGGSMHMFSKEHGFYGGHGIVAAQVPIGAGLAFRHKYEADGHISVTYLGDGAVNQGQVYETFNMAALWSLPALFVIENNRYAMGTSVERAAALPDLHLRGQAYGIPGVKVDGMDVEAVYAAAQEAVAHVRSGKGAYIMEMMTYRYRGHSMSDPAKYRTREEVQKVRSEQDPIEHLKEKLLRIGAADADALKAIDSQVKARVAAAADFAQSSPEPDLAELYSDVYA